MYWCSSRRSSSIAKRACAYALEISCERLSWEAELTLRLLDQTANTPRKTSTTASPIPAILLAARSRLVTDCTNTYRAIDRSGGRLEPRQRMCDRFLATGHGQALGGFESARVRIALARWLSRVGD